MTENDFGLDRMFHLVIAIGRLNSTPLPHVKHGILLITFYFPFYFNS